MNNLKFNIAIKKGLNILNEFFFSGNADLVHMTQEELRKKFICGKHFKKEDFLSRKLCTSAVPVAFNVQRQHPSKVYGRREMDTMEDPQPSTSSSISSKHEVRYLTPPSLEASPSKGNIETSLLGAVVEMPSPQTEISVDTPRKKVLKRKLFTVKKNWM